MSLRIGSLQSRLLAIGLLLGVIAIVYRAAIVPMWGYYVENQESIESYREQTVRFRQIARELPQLERVLAALEQRRDLVGYALPRTSPTLAAASLQNQVKALTGRSGGTLTSTQVLPVVEEAGFQRVAVSVRMTVSVDGLQKILYSLEAARPALFIDNLAIIPRATRGRDGERTEHLDVRFDVSGFMRIEEAEQAVAEG